MCPYACRSFAGCRPSCAARGGVVSRKSIMAEEGSQAKVPGEFLIGFVTGLTTFSLLLSGFAL